MGVLLTPLASFSLNTFRSCSLVMENRLCTSFRCLLPWYHHALLKPPRTALTTRAVSASPYMSVSGAMRKRGPVSAESQFFVVLFLFPCCSLGVRTILLLQSMIVIRHPSVPGTLHQREPGERGQEGAGDVTELPPLSDIADDKVGEVKHHSRNNQSDWSLRSTASQASDMV